MQTFDENNSGDLGGNQLQQASAVNVIVGELPTKQLKYIASACRLQELIPEHYTKDNEGKLTVNDIIEIANIECLPQEDIKRIEEILNRKELDLKVRFKEINLVLAEITSKSEFQEVELSKIAFSLGCPELSYEQAAYIKALADKLCFFKPDQELISEIERVSCRLEHCYELELHISNWVNIAKDIFNLPQPLEVVISDSYGGMLIEPSASLLAIEPKIVIQNYPTIPEITEYGVKFDFLNIEDNSSIFFHELAHICFFTRLIQDIPEINELKKESEELEELLEDGGLGERMLIELNYLEIKPENRIALPPPTTGYTLKELKEFREYVNQKSEDYNRKVENITNIITPYLELFSDMATIVITGEADCVARVIGEQFRNYASGYSVKEWDKDEVHLRLVPTGCMIWEKFLSKSDLPTSEQLAILMSSISDEIKVKLASSDNSETVASSNETLIERLFNVDNGALV